MTISVHDEMGGSAERVEHSWVAGKRLSGAQGRSGKWVSAVERREADSGIVKGQPAGLPAGTETVIFLAVFHVASPAKDVKPAPDYAGSRSWQRRGGAHAGEPALGCTPALALRLAGRMASQREQMSQHRGGVSEGLLRLPAKVILRARMIGLGRACQPSSSSDTALLGLTAHFSTPVTPQRRVACISCIYALSPTRRCRINTNPTAPRLTPTFSSTHQHLNQTSPLSTLAGHPLTPEGGQTSLARSEAGQAWEEQERQQE